MSQTPDYLMPTVKTSTKTEPANWAKNLNENLGALATLNAGATAPTYAEAYHQWLDTSATPWVLKIYDGEDWIKIAEIDPAANTFRVPGSKKVTKFENGGATKWTPDKYCNAAEIWGVGGGGGSGDADTAPDQASACAGGGGAGGFYRLLVAADIPTTATINVGAGGAGGAGGWARGDGTDSGTTGGFTKYDDTSTGGSANMVALGGAGAAAARGDLLPRKDNGGAGGTATGGDINITGGRGDGAQGIGKDLIYRGYMQSISGAGGDSPFGFGAGGSMVRIGGASANEKPGYDGTGYGSGGGGPAAVNGSNPTSGDGANGIVIIVESLGA